MAYNSVICNYQKKNLFLNVLYQKNEVAQELRSTGNVENYSER